MKFHQKEPDIREHKCDTSYQKRGSCKIWQNFPKVKILSFGLGLKVVELFTYDTKPKTTSPPNSFHIIYSAVIKNHREY